MASVFGVLDRTGNAGARLQRLIEAEGGRLFDRGDAALARRQVPHGGGPRTGATSAGDDVCVVVAGRIDNRSILAGHLGLDDGASDADVVRRAYRAWDDAFLDRLGGVFALLLWDGRREQLLCARDRTGVRHLYYALPGDSVIVASGIDAVLEDADVSDAVNQAFIAEYLTGNVPHRTRTFYADVHRLLPGTVLVAGRQCTAVRRYWNPIDGNPNTRWGTAVTGPPARRFRRILADAVARRLEGVPDPAVLLSGGLDSGTVATLVGDQSKESPLAVSVLPSDIPDVDEASGARAVASNAGLHLEQLEWSGPTAHPEVLQQVQPTHPCIDSSLGLYAAASRTVSTTGRDVAFTGLGGNLADGNRLYYATLARRGQFRHLLRDLITDDVGTATAVLLYVIGPLLGRSLPGEMRAVDHGVPNAVVDVASARRPTGPGIDERPAVVEFDRPERRHLWQALTDPYVDFASDAARRVGLHHGVVFRHPLLDARLVSLLFSLPPGTLRRGARGKALFRRAVGELLPAEVRSRSVSDDGYGPVVDRYLRSELVAEIERLGPGSALDVLPFVDGAALGEHCRSYLDGEHDRYQSVWRLLTTEWWLRARD